MTNGDGKIDDGRVLAGAMALMRSQTNFSTLGDPSDDDVRSVWNGLPDMVRDRFMEQARAVIEAADEPQDGGVAIYGLGGRLYGLMSEWNLGRLGDALDGCEWLVESDGGDIPVVYAVDSEGIDRLAERIRSIGGSANVVIGHAGSAFVIPIRDVGSLSGASTVGELLESQRNPFELHHGCDHAVSERIKAEFAEQIANLMKPVEDMDAVLKYADADIALSFMCGVMKTIDLLESADRSTVFDAAFSLCRDLGAYDDSDRVEVG